MSKFDRTEAALRAVKYWVDGTPEIRLTKEFSDPQRVSIDVGANIGQFTWWMRRYASGVIAYEPIPELAARLERAFGDDVEVRRAAASATTGSAVLSIPTASDGSDRAAAASISNDFPDQRTIDVPLERIDDLDRGPVGYIKIDVEGHELDVLSGAEETLRRDHPTLLVEIELRHHDGEIASKVGAVCEYGYEAWFWQNDEFHPFSEFRPEMQDSANITNPALYINNFVFSEPSPVFTG